MLGNSLSLYNPPIAVAEEFAMLDVITGGRLVAGFPVGTSMDTNFCYGDIPALHPRAPPEAQRSGRKTGAGPRPFALNNGCYTKLRHVNTLAEADPETRRRIHIPGGGSRTYDFCLDNVFPSRI
ncbi:MAG: hypothetical protein IPK48_15005 [Gammaproteobacteria bacterium]|nr:hypothetical protein [Gammaproteobacteria bacterium]